MHIYRSRVIAAILLAGIMAVSCTGCAFVDTLVNGLPASDSPAENTPVPSQIVVTPAPATEAPTETPAAGQKQLVPFPQMIYERPNADQSVNELMNLAALIRTADNEALATSLLDQAGAIYDTYETATVLAMIHSSIDRSDPVWTEEYDYCSTNGARIATALTEVTAALSESPAGQAMGLLAPDPVLTSQEMEDLSTTESQLVAQYYNLLSTLTVNFEGQELTYSQITGARAYAAWHEQNGPTLGDIYIQLLRVRKQMAQLAGYDNYIDFVFSTGDKGYTPDMISQTLDAVVQYMVPIYTELSRKGYYDIDPQYDQDVVFTNLRDWLTAMDPAFTSAIDLMSAYQLYDLAPGANKENNAYTTYISDYGAPFLFATVDGSYEDMMDVFHEFGHFYAYTVDPEFGGLSTETVEVPSTALPLLASNYFTTTYGAQQSGAMLYNLLADYLTTFVQQAYYTSFEMTAYLVPDEQLTYENLCALSAEQWARFGLGGSDTIAATDWTSTIHIYESPFYTFAYIPATDCAMQLWEQSTINPAGAAQIYQTFIGNASEGAQVAENMQICGLQSPFEVAEMQTQADWFVRFLLNDEAMPLAQSTAVATPTPAQSEGLTQEGTLTATQAPPTPTPVPVSTPTPIPMEPLPEPTSPDTEVTPGPLEISPPDSDRYGDTWGITDGDNTLVWPPAA